MRLSLSTKWFIWLSATIATFCLAQVLGMIWMETSELMRGEGTLGEELSEIAVLASVSVCVFVLMSGGFWFISRRMMRPIRDLADTANRISEGARRERLASGDSAEEVRLLTTALNRAFDRYNDMVEQLDKFAGNAAHQLRTPLASIRSVSEVCLQKERNPSEYRECIEEVLSIVDEMTESVEKLLMIARLNPSRIRQQFAAVEVKDVLTDVLALFDVVIEEKHIALKQEDMPHLTIMGDRNLVRQAIANVVENAVQFTPPGGIVAVALLERDRHVVLQVSDTGPGMQEAMHLHAVGDRAANWNGELPAGRMGLAIVSEIMRIHNGTLHIQPCEEGGTCVELGWPC
jgi:signal transduction histidine kinase